MLLFLVCFMGTVCLVGGPATGQTLPTENTRPRAGITDKTPAAFALRGGKIVVSPEDTIESGTLVVRDGNVIAVGSQISIPADATVIDTTGQTIYAGWLDAYSELAVEWPSQQAGYWNPTVTPQRSLHRNAQVSDDQHAAWRAQGITARLLAPDRGIIRGMSCVMLTGGRDRSNNVLASDVALHVRLSPSPQHSGYPGSPMGAVALARQAFLDADWYVRAQRQASLDSTAQQPDTDVSLEQLANIREQGRLVLFNAMDEQYFLRADQFAREFGLSAAVVGSGQEYRRLDAIRATGRTVIAPLNFPLAPNVATNAAALEVSLEQLMHWDLAPENLARLQQAQIPFCLTSHGLAQPSDWLPNLRRAVARGLSPTAALKALTQTPAELFGISEQVGALRPGMLANFFICDGDVFAEKTKILATWVDGRRYPVSAPRTVRLHGTWHVRSGPPLLERQAKLSITDEGDKVSAELVFGPTSDEKRLALEHVTWQHGLLAGHFPGTAWSVDGVIQLDAVHLPSQAGRPATLTGHVVWPDGARYAWTAEQTLAQPLGPLTPPTPSGTPSSAAPANASPENAPPTNSPAPNSQAANSQPTSTNPAPDTAAANSANKPAEAAAAAAQPASFAVNFPLGDYGRATPPTRASWIAFEHATVWTCGAAGVLPDATILVHDGEIVAVGTAVAVPADAERVDLRGRHVTPGIIDCHSHMATDGGVNESTQAITAEVRIGDFIDATDISIYRQLAGGVTAANILHGSANPIGGQNQVIKLRWGKLPEELKFAEAPAGIKFALGENVKQSNWGADATGRYPQSRMGVPELLRDAFYNAQEYQLRWREWQNKGRGTPPRRDLELEALAEILAGQRWIHCHSYRQDEILATLRVLEDFHVQIGTLQHILEGYKVAEAMRSHGAMASSFSDWWAYKFEVYDAIPFNGALMHQQGVVVSFNSDDAELARRLNHEAAKANKYGGVPLEEALKFVTLNPARQLRIDRWVGSLEPGKHADLVVWSGPPLDSFTRCEQTWIDGAKYFDHTEDQQAQLENHQRRTQLIQKILAQQAPMQPAGTAQPAERDLWPREDIFCKAHGRH